MIFFLDPICDIPSFEVEIDPEKHDLLAIFAVFHGIFFVFDLLHCLVRGLVEFELENIDRFPCADIGVNAPLVGLRLRVYGLSSPSDYLILL